MQAESKTQTQDADANGAIPEVRAVDFVPEKEAF